MNIPKDKLKSEVTTPRATPSPSPTPSVPYRNNKLIIVVGIVTLLVLAGVVVYYLVTKGVKNTTVYSTSDKEQLVPAANSNPTSTTEVLKTPLFSGSLKRLSQNLKIFKTTEADSLNGTGDNVVYYEAGKFVRGELADYVRVIAIKSSWSPAGPLVFILATKDYQTYVLDDPDNSTTNSPEDDPENPFYLLEKNKIVSTKTFDTEQPKEIKLNQSYSLYAEDFLTDYVATSKIDKNGNQIDDTPLVTNYSSYQKLTSPFNHLTIYFKPYKTDTSYLTQLSKSEREKIQLKQKYLLGETEAVVVDSVGLPIRYSYTTSDNINNYKDKSAQFEIALKKYQDQLKQYNDNQITKFPVYPAPVPPPGLGFVSSKIARPGSLRLYKDYEAAIPGACTVSLNSYVVDLSENDLEKIGSVGDLPLYRLKDADHPLYTLAFKNKMDYYEQSPTTWDGVNEGIAKPTLVEYVNANPLLFIKDYWGRWVALGEFDIKLPGGCGKPVIYLYPEQPTRVSVKFQAPIQLTTDIPKYADFWQVTAYPDGSLVNLKPELTICSKIDSRKKGSEYAQEACQKNTYPYLYWAGNVISKNYPMPDKGWVVGKDNLEIFLQSKLTEVGLNDREKNDFMDYWLPDMAAKNVPYYRISFLQTHDLNSLFPMIVSPIPDTTFRFFLDYRPLTSKPLDLPQPQTLRKLVRKGFTLVEWGGLKQP